MFYITEYSYVDGLFENQYTFSKSPYNEKSIFLEGKVSVRKADGVSDVEHGLR